MDTKNHLYKPKINPKYLSKGMANLSTISTKIAYISHTKKIPSCFPHINSCIIKNKYI